MSEKLD